MLIDSYKNGYYELLKGSGHRSNYMLKFGELIKDPWVAERYCSTLPGK
jgi:hypothetical protein